MFFGWFKNRRRRRWLAERWQNTWESHLRENVWQYAHLDGTRQQRVRNFVHILFHEKDWVGGNRLAVTDEMRVTIAGQAALLTLGFEKPYYFDRLQTIIVYSGVYHSQPAETSDLILGHLESSLSLPDVRSGESWQGGPIVLAWQATKNEGRRPKCGRSVVIHEFAHHMDSLDGVTDGAPPMTDFQFEKKWYQVTSAEYNRLVQSSQRGERTLLDRYGATNHAEFFAVAAECFFTRPHQLASEHNELYAVLERLFGQDPREWLPPLSAS
ncbi:M90 family metallopeptidase [Bythopirellula polymerisocia]|uniref:Protein MtfA n=1 Tax=Bythopirellula polymerisocia TaxID=2528003 RepID=A0A5C6CSR4_9BACT|nr:M90 family metallopeptidase [Bythopirellula polymerisocia]TWU27428.1 Protein MtfA [Bythopirellula polymerisocia]